MSMSDIQAFLCHFWNGSASFMSKQCHKYFITGLFTTDLRPSYGGLYGQAYRAFDTSVNIGLPSFTFII